MPRHVVRYIDCSERLLATEAAWDDLWRRSHVSSPRARAALVAQWLQQFGARRRFRAVLVEQDGALVAALPLVESRLRGLVRVASLPGNQWGTYGDLLLDPACEQEAVLDALVAALDELRWPLLWLDHVPFESLHWQAFLAACRRGGLATSVREHFRVGQVHIEHDWNAYVAGLKGNHRRTRRRNAKAIEQAGGAELKVYSQLQPQDVQDHLARGFEVEDRSWKGLEGSSVLKSTGMLDFFRREAEQLAVWGQLELCFLERQGQAIAFDYGWNAKGIHAVAKFGYDEAYSKFSPGHLLVMKLLERMHADRGCRALDFWGPLVPWTASWATHSYPVGRVVVALPGGLARGIFHAYEHWQPRLKSLSPRFVRSYGHLVR